MRLEPAAAAEPLVRGQAIHALLRQYDEHGMVVLDDHTRAEDRALLRAYSAYYTPWPQGSEPNRVFAIRLSSLTLVGEVDLKVAGENRIVEHKTTSSPIQPGSSYWQEIAVADSQAAAYSLAFPGAIITWDALRKPKIEQRLATPEAERRYTKPTRAAPSRLYAGQRTDDETETDYENRVFAAIAEEPEKYFQRLTVVRRQEELDAFTESLRSQVEAMQSARTYKNTESCFSFGRRCDFYDMCWGGASLSSPQFKQKRRNHTEELAERLP